MALKIEREKVPAGKRAIVISDIHANLSIFKKLLHKVNYTKDDILILLGDMVEKGPESLETLRFIMNLKKENTVYAVCGNCDAIALEINRDERNQDLLKYINIKKNTLIGEMCRAAGIEVSRDLDMLAAKKELRNIYQEELTFIASMPHVLELNEYVFAHAAMKPEGLADMKPSQVMKADAFMELGYHFTKYHIVGHWPTVLYCKKIPVCNPKIDYENKIISIDGANVLMRDGQLNALLIPDLNQEKFTFTYVDELPKARILNTQETGEESFYISWNDAKVKALRREKEFTYCEHISSGKKMWIPNSYLSERRGEWYAEDITDYQLPLTFGDIVSVTEETNRGYIVKKNGVCGWYYGMLEYVNDPDGI